MTLEPMQVAQQLLSRPVGGGLALGGWLEKEFPKAADYIQNKYQVESRPARSELAVAFNLPGLRDELGTGRFEIAYQEALGMLQELGHEPADGRLRYQMETVHSCRRQFNEIGDMRAQITHDILPYLQDISSGKAASLDVVQLTDMYNACRVISGRLQRETPSSLQPENSQQAYDTFAEDMKLLLRYAHQTDGQKRTARALAPQESHTESLQYRNRIDDYWRQR